MRQIQGHAFAMAIDQLDLRLLFLRTPTALAVNRMAASLKARGQLTPIIITEKVPVVVDGFKRIQAARDLGMDSLKTTCLSADPIRAKAMMYLMNRSGSFSMIQEGLLVRELVDTHGISQTDAAAMLERHKSWVNRRLLMIRRLAPEIIEDLKLELLPPGSAPILARLQPCNQGEFSIAIQTHRLSAKQVRHLIELWCKAPDPAVKHFVLQSPTEALQVVGEAKAPSSTAENIIRKIWQLLGMLERQYQGKEQIEQPVHQVQAGLMAIHQALSRKNP